jgi:hypothetical protein
MQGGALCAINPNDSAVTLRLPFRIDSVGILIATEIGIREIDRVVSSLGGGGSHPFSEQPFMMYGHNIRWFAFKYNRGLL